MSLYISSIKDDVTLKRVINYVEDSGDEPIHLIINTIGGSVVETLGIYDYLSFVKKSRIVATNGLAKVMSAGLLLLSMGTPGYRFIGANTRLMFHAVVGEMEGSMHDLDILMNQCLAEQDLYIDALVESSKKTKRFYNRLLKTKSDHYFGANTAVKWGIADSVI